MKLRNLFLIGLASAVLFAGCKKEDDLGPAQVSIDPATPYEFPEEGGEYLVELTATIDWALQGYDEEVQKWLSINPTSGNASKSPQTITIKATSNTDTDRSATITFYGDIMHKASLTISQKGTKAVEGSAENPFTVAAALQAITDNKWTSSNPSPEYYVKGIISSIEEIDTGEFGNATYYISDDGTRANELNIFRGYYLEGAKFTSADQIKVGDEVVVAGKLIDYNGTPEMNNGNKITYHKDNGGVEVGPDLPDDAVVFEVGNNIQTWNSVTDGTYGAGFETTTDDNITVGYYKYKSSTNLIDDAEGHIRVYKSSAFRIKADKAISRIVLFCTAEKYCVDLTPLVGDGTYTIDTSYFTIDWSGNANEIVAAANAGQVRISKIAVVYAE